MRVRQRERWWCIVVVVRRRLLAWLVRLLVVRVDLHLQWLRRLVLCVMGRWAMYLLRQHLVVHTIVVDLCLRRDMVSV